MSVTAKCRDGDLITVNLIADEKDVDVAFYYRKRPDYRTEEEVRLISRRTAGAWHPFEPSLLTRIILGKQMTPEDRTRIREWAAMRVPPLVVVQASYDLREHRLTQEEASPFAAR